MRPCAGQRVACCLSSAIKLNADIAVIVVKMAKLPRSGLISCFSRG